MRFGRFAAWSLGVLAVLAIGAGWLVWSTVQGLPQADALARYTPPLPSTVRDRNGLIVTSFVRERRIYLPYDEIPKQLIDAYLAAEDKTFYSHGGLDYAGIAQAIWTNVRSFGSDRRPVGASTITQQVAKNLLLNSELTYTRKLKEAVLASRIETAFTKPQILELYLNQIFLGRNAYGVEAAAQAYFNRSANQLTLEEMAFLAVLPKAPSNYNPVTRYARALGRRNWVLEQMAGNGFISRAAMAEAQAKPLVVTQGPPPRPERGADYFMEDVRRQLIARFGDGAETGPNSVYGGGLWIRTSFDPVLQSAAETALRDGLMRYDRGRPWRGPAKTIDDLGEDWARQLRRANLGVGYKDWYPAVVLANDGGFVRLGFVDGSTGRMPPWAANKPMKGTATPASALLKRGDVIPVAKAGGDYALRQIPEISGGMVAEDPHTGRLLALVGGFDARGSSFNRATQAQRQPGSTFKPIAYAAALDNGFTPSSIIVDAPYCVYQSRKLGRKCFRNFGGGRGAGPQTMRWGLEQSRNLMTVRLAYNAGMDKVVQTAKALGIGDYQPVLAIALGAGETTVLKLTNAYAQLFNHGRALTPTLIDYVQDRNGKVIWRADTRACPRCDAADWDGGPMPRPGGVPRQAIDARTAYQTVHMMEGVVTRGTATRLLDLDRPLAGKTGTTSGPKDAWFIGGTQDLVAGLYIGYDQPRDLGGWVQGGNTAAPIWKDFGKVALADAPKLPFTIPAGVRMVRVDRRSGKRVFGAWPTSEAKAAVIWEAFKPESEPRRVGSVSGRDDEAPPGARPGLPGVPGAPRVVRSDAEFLRNSGNIY